MGMNIHLPSLAPVRMTYDTHTQFSAACAAVCQKTEERDCRGRGRDSYIMASFPARTCRGGRKYLQGRSQVLAGKVACISVEDAVHCKDGCSALQERLQCTARAVAVHCV